MKITYHNLTYNQIDTVLDETRHDIRKDGFTLEPSDGAYVSRKANGSYVPVCQVIRHGLRTGPTALFDLVVETGYHPPVAKALLKRVMEKV